MRSGQSRVLVLRGEAGIGKTALLEYVVERAAGWRIARASGVESEMELPFAGLHQLCAPMLDGLDRLPGPQQDALRVAFGLQEGATPDHFFVALAVLSLLAEAAEARPLVCLVDDAQWLDRGSAQALAFVARRLLAERIAMVFAVREPDPADVLAGLPELVVKGIADGDARALLASALPGMLDERIRDRIVGETHGNPLALMELPRGLTPAELAGGFGLPDRDPLPGRIERSFRRRFESLPPDSRRLLLTAAAEPIGDVTLLWRAAERLGIAPDAAAPAEAAELITLGARVRFRHPLVRSAVYRAAPVRERQEVHRALAEATDPEADPDRRAWHRAHAAAALDEAVAAELERSAERARRRGGVAAAAAFLAAGGRADARPGAPRRTRARRRRGQARGREAARPRRSCSRPRSSRRWTKPSARGCSDCARRSRSSSAAAATVRRSWSTPPGGSRRSIRRWRARPTSRRSERRCTPDVSTPTPAWRRWPRRRAPRPSRRSRRGRSTSSSTAWHAVHGGARGGRAAAQARAPSGPGASRSTATERSCAGCCCPRSSSR